MKSLVRRAPGGARGRRSLKTVNPIRAAVYAEAMESRYLLAADLAVGVTNAPNPVLAGNQLTYTITLNNTGDAAASNVNVSDALPAGTTFVSASSTSGAFTLNTPAVGSGGTFSANSSTLANGAGSTFTLVVAVPPSAANGATLSDTASASTTSTETTLTNNSATTSATVNTSANISIVETAPSQVVAGQTLTYNITVANSGPSDAQNVNLLNNLPANTSLQTLTQNSGPTIPGTLPAGATATFTLVLSVSPAAPNGSTLTNTGSVNTTTTDPVPANNSTSVNTTVVTPADLKITKTGPATAVAGTNVIYTLVVQNTGAQDAANVSISDLLPASETFVSQTQTAGPAFTLSNVGGNVNDTISTLIGGGSATITVTAKVNSNVASGATVTNAATAATTLGDPTPADNTSSASTTISTSADISVLKTGPANITAGTNGTYTITVSNAGPSDAQGVTLADALPANETLVSQNLASGTSLPGVLPAGGTSVYTVIATLAANAPDASTVSNTATVTTTTTDPTPANNTSTAKAIVQTRADLAVTEAVVPAGPFNEGDAITYQLSLTNNGPSDAKNVTISDAVLANSAFVSLKQTSGPIFGFAGLPAVGGTGNVNGNVSTLASGQSATFLVTVTAVEEGPLANTVTVNSSSTTDPVAADNSARADLTILDAPLSAISQPDIAGVEGNPLNFITLATFSDAHQGEVPSEYSATVQWGDGTGTDSSAVVVGDGRGTYYVLGSHQYTLEGDYTTTVTVTDVGGSTLTLGNSVLITDATLKGTLTPPALVEGQAFSGTLATLSDADKLANDPTNYTAVINWGDGTTTTGAITGGSQNFAIAGSHTYATNGNYATTVSITDDDGGATLTLKGTTVVTDAPLSGVGKSFTGTESFTSGGTVAAFTDGNALQTSPGIFSSTIDWGDGAKTAGSVVADGKGGFLVNGTHVYKLYGAYTVNVSVTDPGGQALNVSSTATIADAPLTAFARTFTATHNVAFTNKIIGSFTDANYFNFSGGVYTISIDWGDKTAKTAGTAVWNSFSKQFDVYGSHKYLAKAPTGGYKLRIIVTDGFGNPAPFTQSVSIYSVGNVA